MDRYMRLRFLTAGESHGPALTAILDGIPAGLDISKDYVNQELARRQKGYGAGPRMKIEQDAVRITGGILEGKTSGAPISLIIQNRDHEKWRGKEIPPFTIPRPGHADLTGTLKYGYSDLRPALERASARETAARVAVGAICKQFLEYFNIIVGGYVLSIAEITAQIDRIELLERLKLAESSPVRCPDHDKSKEMEERIRRVMEEKDTLGGIIETIALGVPPGLGSFVQLDRRLDARLGAAILSIQAVKGVEIGPAFQNSRLPGTKVQDPVEIRDNYLSRSSNRAGGIEGGISNGQPIVIRAAMKPIATTLSPQKTVDILERKDVPTQYERSDFCPVPRVVPILEAMTAYILADALLEKLGGDNMIEIKTRYKQLHKNEIDGFNLNGKAHIFWPEEDEG
jgi:chorismate synthase